MSPAPNFSSILDRPSNTVVRPPAAPIGNYVWAIKGLPKRDKSTKKQTEYIEYTCKAVSYIEGTVDEEELAGFGGLAKVPEHKLTFYMTEKSGYRLKEFLQNDLGFEWDEAERTLWQVAQEANGAQFLCTL